MFFYLGCISVRILRFRLIYYGNLPFAGIVASCVTDVNVSGVQVKSHVKIPM